MAFPDWLRILYYVLFNLIVATELFTIDLSILTSVDGGDIFVHSPATIGDWLNLAQFGTVWFIASVIYTCYLLISLVPLIVVPASTGPKDDRKWFDALFSGFHIIFLNPPITILGVASLYPQCRAILGRPRESGPGALSLLGLAAQAVLFLLVGFNYCLNPIGRIVYEIHNPHFYSAKPWPGGIPEMARHYVGLMRKAVPRGRILLGGWSLGGLLSLEMARLLAGDPDFTVVGIAMVDSICPASRTTKTGVAKAAVVPYKHQFGANTKQETIEGVERCFVEARKSIETWTMPRWDGSDIEGGDGCQKGADAVGAGEGQLPDPVPSPSIKCPPTILLRAREAVPTEPGEVSFVDTTRHSRSLGWDEYQKDFLEEIVDIPGHHFSIFAWEHIDEVSQKLMDACNILEKMAAVTAS
ncbi:hypothetical protein SLS64_005622 [Diaporthe eres]